MFQSQGRHNFIRFGNKERRYFANGKCHDKFIPIVIVCGIVELENAQKLSSYSISSVGFDVKKTTDA